MNTTFIFKKFLQVLAIGLLPVFFGSACTVSGPIATGKPVIQTVPVTQLATVMVTQEVTRVFEIPVTVTPADMNSISPTPSTTSPITASPASMLEPMPVTILAQSDCMYGPGVIYLYKYSVFPDNPTEAIGRNLDGSWLYIQAAGGWNPCWIQAASVKLMVGNIDTLPVVYSTLPFSNQYNSPDASAHRDGTQVTITWKADWMSLDDYRGYLIEAWLCQGGKQVFDPISYIPPLASNTGTLSVKVTDEAGCSTLSMVRMYSAQKQGYSNWSNVPWLPAAPGN
jgi:hypothetical protein